VRARRPDGTSRLLYAGRLLEWRQINMTAEVKRSVVNKQAGEVTQRWCRVGSRQNHLFDAECLQVLAALMVRTLPLKEQETAPGVVTETVEI
jgi:hypothetical protein